MTSNTLKATVAVIALTAGSAFAQTATTDTDAAASADTEATASASVKAPEDEGMVNDTGMDTVAEDDGMVDDTGMDKVATDTAPETDSADVAADDSTVAPSVSDTAETEMDSDTSTDVATDDAADVPAADATAEADAATDTDTASDEATSDDANATAEADATATTDTEVAGDSATDSTMVDNFAGMIASDIIGMNVTQADGEDIGEVDSIVRDNGELAAVVGIGGFLGLGEHSVAVPLSELSRGEDGQLMLTSLTKAELDAQAEVDDEAVEKLEAEAPLDAAS